MLCAKQKSTGEIITAYLASKSDAPFFCPECGDQVLLKTGKTKINYFAHINLLSCQLAEGESEAHRYCKLEIYEALLQTPGVSDAQLERPLGSNRPDVSAYINGVPVAIEVQISSLSLETIIRRTIDYHQKGIYVLWLLQWKPELDGGIYSPKIWEKWIHTAYFGRVYYWKQGLEIVSYTFEPSLRSVPRKTWYNKDGRMRAGGGFTRRLKRSRTAVRGATLNLTRDFEPRERFWWDGGGLKVPDAKLFVGNDVSWN